MNEVWLTSELLISYFWDKLLVLNCYIKYIGFEVYFQKLDISFREKIWICVLARFCVKNYKFPGSAKILWAVENCGPYWCIAELVGGFGRPDWPKNVLVWQYYGMSWLVTGKTG